MPLYLVSYDLTKEKEFDYENLWDYLRKENAVRVLFSEWLMASDASASDLVDEIREHMHDQDYLWVLEVTKDRLGFG
ncbi:MAG TPA: hypothetical protein VFP26_10520 [Gemmatimonadaceae bacterium]|nr:hypothetical protein [Gemmatimonadaceae bacterium]